jgi:hypothetical protein
MKHACLVGMAIALGGASCASRPNTPPSDSPSGTTCLVTVPRDGRDGVYGNDALAVFLSPDGKLIFRPGGPGFVDHDGALGIKFGWKRRKKGPLFVGGRRLDGAAAPARAYISYDSEDIGIQPTYLVFPTPGCWEITGSVADASLTFVLLVEKIGDGPSWRFEGLPPGWRVTSRSSGP